MKVAVIGAGAAGMIAALESSKNGNETILFEKNEKLGKKLYITGKGRCNLTNFCDESEFLENIPSNPYFLYSSIYTFNSEVCIKYFENLGLKLKVERGNRVFPESDKSSDVIKALEKALVKNGVKIRLNTCVEDILIENDKLKGIKVLNEDISFDKVIIATGGLSYPQTGSTGDGYRFAKSTGHEITALYPSLVSIEVCEKWISDLAGLSLKNVELSLKQGKKTIYKNFGEMLFSHKGISGPIVLSASRKIIDIRACSHYKNGNICEPDFSPFKERERRYRSVIHQASTTKNGGIISRKDDYSLAGTRPKQPFDIFIDLKPALTEKELDLRLLKDFEKFINKDFKNALDDLLPQKLIPIFVMLSGISPDKKINEITKLERNKITHMLKNFKLTFKNLGGYNEAVVTAGGVSVKDIDPSTMQSKKVAGLYFAGEVIDVDGFTGGFNLQIAFSTGYVAGQN